MTYIYYWNHEPIDFQTPLWKIKNNREKEWNEIFRLLSLNKKTVNLFDSKIDFSEISEELNKIVVKSNKTFGWLTQKSVQIFEFRSSIVTFLRDLHDTYSELVLLQDLDNVNQSKDLGASFSLSVEAKGVPRPQYTWLFLPLSLTDDKPNWKSLPLHPMSKTIKITNFSSEDEGYYRCHIRHGIDTQSSSMSSCLHQGILSRYVKITIEEGSILITQQPESVLAFLQSSATFVIKAVSSQQLSYTWCHNDVPILGAQSNTLVLRHLKTTQGGRYHCLLQNGIKGLESEKVSLSIQIPNFEDIARENLNFENENILILEEPQELDVKKRANIGDKITLSVTAVCKYTLRYEWLKRGLSQNLIINSGETRLTEAILVSRGPQLYDEITPSHNSDLYVGTWIYGCVIYCPHTGERTTSKSIRIPLSTHHSPNYSFPSFKIALIICQEDYKVEEDFHELMAPKYDGATLIKALQSMDFEILAFLNLSVEEIRNAVQLLTRFIDKETYVLFYYNGHALGYGSDIYLTGIDSEVNPNVPLESNFVWHGEIESSIDGCHPLLAVIIYDSCRDNPPESLVNLVKNTSHDTISVSSNFCISYGTQPLKKSFECYEKLEGAIQGLYMKYLAKHLTENIRVEEMFLKMSDSFTRGEDESVVSQMRPELKNATKQAFFLTAPLRSTAHSSAKQKDFFSLVRYEANIPPVSLTFSQNYALDLGLCFQDSLITWITGNRNSSSYDVRLTLKITPSIFLNEALLTLSSVCSPEFFFPSFSVQLIGVNCWIVSSVEEPSWASHGELYAIYEPSNLETSCKNGPIFSLKEPCEKECKLIQLQCIHEKKVKIRLSAHYNGIAFPCKGVCEFALPIVKNFSQLKIQNDDTCRF